MVRVWHSLSQPTSIQDGSVCHCVIFNIIKDGKCLPHGVRQSKNKKNPPYFHDQSSMSMQVGFCLNINFSGKLMSGGLISARPMPSGLLSGNPLHFMLSGNKVTHEANSLTKKKAQCSWACGVYHCMLKGSKLISDLNNTASREAQLTRLMTWFTYSS